MYNSFKYYVSDHAKQGLLLHIEGCKHLPSVDERFFIGSCYTPNHAITVASSQFTSIVLCPFCLTNHTNTETHELDPPVTLCKPSKPARKKITKKVQPVRHFPI